MSRTGSDRIDVLESLVIEAAKEVAEQAPGQFPHLERMLKYMQDEVTKYWEMQSDALKFRMKIDRQVRELAYPKREV